MPSNNSEAGLPDPDDYDRNDYMRRLEISTLPKKGAITITFKIPGSKAYNKELQLIPSTATGVVSWTCKARDVNGIAANHVPPNCHG